MWLPSVTIHPLCKRYYNLEYRLPAPLSHQIGNKIVFPVKMDRYRGQKINERISLKNIKKSSRFKTSHRSFPFFIELAMQEL